MSRTLQTSLGSLSSGELEGAMFHSKMAPLRGVCIVGATGCCTLASDEEDENTMGGEVPATDDRGSSGDRAKVGWSGRH